MNLRKLIYNWLSGITHYLLSMKRNFVFILIGLPLIVLFTNHCFPRPDKIATILYYFSALSLSFGILLLIPFNRIPAYIFDNQEWRYNDSIPRLVKKIRLRALLFFNISVIIFIVTIMVIIAGFYVLIHPDVNTANPMDIISIRLSATAILIFLVQILFRLFKYLLRIAAFYTGKADAMELHQIKGDIGLDKLMEMFTPDKYDISDIASPSLFDKGKSG